MVVHSISSYGDRPNNYEEVSEYFRAHFIQVQKRKDVAGRTLYVVSIACSLDSSLVKDGFSCYLSFSALHFYASKLIKHGRVYYRSKLVIR